MNEAFAGYWKQTCGLLLLALTLRLALALAFPFLGGDSPIYESFARNLLKSGVYSHLNPEGNAPPNPTMIRCPGYPLVLAAIFAVAGENGETAARIFQAFLDTLTCLLVPLIVFEISSRDIDGKRILAQRALLLCTVCPFVAVYSASILTEVPATFLWVCGTLFGLRALNHERPSANWFFCGLTTGAANMFRPESGLLAGILALVLLLREGTKRAWRPLLVGCGMLAGGLALALVPWTLRNLVTMRTFQPLAPFYAQDQNERVPKGFLDWCSTWLWTYRDVGNFVFAIDEIVIPPESLPSRAADDSQQRQAELDLLAGYNQTTTLDQGLDDRFQAIALERQHRHPLRSFIELPGLRAVSMWFTPRVEVLPWDDTILPLETAWESDPWALSVALFLFILNVVYLGLAFMGVASLVRASPFDSPETQGCLALAAILLIRTLFFALFSFPEPRYVLETYPSVIALAAFAFPVPIPKHTIA